MNTFFSGDQPGPGPHPGSSCAVCSHPQQCLSVLGGAGCSWLGTGFQAWEAASILFVAICSAPIPARICTVEPPTSLPGEGATGRPRAWCHPLGPPSCPCHTFSLWLSQALLSPLPSCYLSLCILSVTSRTLEPSQKLLHYPLFGAIPPASLPASAEKPQHLLEWRLCSLSLLPAGLGSLRSLASSDRSG